MMVVSINEPPRMDTDRDHMAVGILDLTLEIIYLITGEDHTVVKKSFGECVTPHVLGEWNRSPGAITEPPPHSLIHEQKIVELTNRITEMLTGEVPIRCQDVTVYLSMEEWEYLEGHKDLYKDIMVKDHHPLTSPDESNRRNPPESCPSPLYFQDCPKEKQNVPLDHEESYGGTTRGPENPTSESLNGEDCMRGSDSHLLLSLAHTVEENQSRISKNRTVQRQGKIFAYSEYGKNFKKKQNLSNHERIHKPEMPFSCSECGECFSHKCCFLGHLKTHTGGKPYSCPECAKCFNRKSHLVVHLRIHTGEKPYSCSECWKCFRHKSGLLRHLKIHTGEKPYLCTVCRKCFRQKSVLVTHQKTHSG
ncbi:oocyte zinc finger protein XlCOF8.4-like [Bufo gargarizans]|uniref:oocyte zinc finger protein XlCOF8.4-like n=1 Tax=Bufo gargarizans TaxID=30331 RepID=UPI001CF1CBAA|nr:oocyte zinc finger protein XlCOF8.4-like [Bufo gargarizans]